MVKRAEELEKLDQQTESQKLINEKLAKQVAQENKKSVKSLTSYAGDPINSLGLLIACLYDQQLPGMAGQEDPLVSGILTYRLC